MYDVTTFYTYGQPRVGNALFATYFKTILSEYRVVHYADIVPHLPPELFNFHHVATEVHGQREVLTPIHGVQGGCMGGRFHLLRDGELRCYAYR